MLIFPAIDIIDGKPVRLFKGDFSTAHQVADDAVETAFGFLKAGCKWVHMVDLDGSLKKEPVNAQTFINVAKETGLRVELGGGIRTMNDIDFYINNGISRIILGSVALKNPELAPLAPLHNPAHLMGYRACLEVVGPDVPQVFVFDTSFHSTMPPKAYMYAVPYEYYEKYAVRR